MFTRHDRDFATDGHVIALIDLCGLLLPINDRRRIGSHGIAYDHGMTRIRIPGSGGQRIEIEVVRRTREKSHS